VWSPYFFGASLGYRPLAGIDTQPRALDVLVIDDPLTVAGRDGVAARVVHNFDDFPEELVRLLLARAYWSRKSSFFMMPHLAEECWAALGHKTLVASEPWPRVEADLLVENTITLPVQINGRKRGDVTVARNAANSEIESAVLALDAVKRALDGRPPKKVIVVPQRIVNVVA